jgi:O-succinylbenzoate synthase
VPLRVAFRGVTAREAVLLHGPAGWGEFAPFVEYDDLESARWLASAIESAWRGHPPPIRDRVSVNATVPAVAPEAVPDVLARFPGCTTAKVKVAEQGQSIGDDVARVAEVRTVLGPHGAIRVDANGAWDVETALDALTRLAAFGLEYAEQPCATLADLRSLRLRLARAGPDVRIAADESIRKADHPLQVAVSGAADLLVIKVAPLGGVTAALGVAERLGADHALPVVVSSALDTSVGLAAGLALAAALPSLPFACGLATAGLLADDVCADPLLPEAGAIQVRRAVPDDERLARLAAPPDRQHWWRERLACCHAVLAGAR